MPLLKSRDDINLFYEVGGQKTGKIKVIFIMGLNANHKAWDFQYEYFSQLPDYQVLIFDNRGCGFSDVPEPPYIMTQMVNDVIDLANFLNWDRFHLVGCSMGGMIAQHVALDHNERILSLTLICTRLEGGFFKSLPSFSGILKFFRMSRTSDPEVSLRVASELLFTDDVLNGKTPEGITFREHFFNLIKKRMVDIPITSTKGKEGQLAILKSHGLSPDEMKKLKDSKFPILALTGDSDILIRSTHSYNMPSQIGAKLIVLEGNGHGLCEQSPDIVNMHIKNLIDETVQKHEGETDTSMNDNIVLSN